MKRGSTWAVALALPGLASAAGDGGAAREIPPAEAQARFAEELRVARASREAMQHWIDARLADDGFSGTARPHPG